MWGAESGKSIKRNWARIILTEDTRLNIADSDDSPRNDRPAGRASDRIGGDDAREHGLSRAPPAKDRWGPITRNDVAAPWRYSLTQFSSQLNDVATVHPRVNQNRRQEHAALLAAPNVAVDNTAPGGHSNSP